MPAQGALALTDASRAAAMKGYPDLRTDFLVMADSFYTTNCIVQERIFSLGSDGYIPALPVHAAESLVGQAPGSAAKLRNAFRERPKRMAVAVRAPEAGVVADPVRFLLIRFSGLVGWDACVAALGAV